MFGVESNPNTKTTIKLGGITFNMKSTSPVYYALGKQGATVEFVIVEKDQRYFKRLKGKK